jgi:2-desacetyl-2-hydroxyethyl bacteriochlorophyllide A dehydrogenase
MALMKSKNIVFTEPRVAALIEQDVPEMGDSQILVRAEHSLISTGTELICFNGEFEPGTHWDQWVKFPFKPGYCMVGTIEKTGAEVSRFAPGDRVAIRSNHKEWSVWDAENTRGLKVPEGVAPDDAPWFGMACIAQIGVRRAQHQLGDAVAIIGAGLLGQLVTQYVRLMGAREIIMIDTAPARLELAKQHGATQVLDMTADKAHDAVYDLTDGKGADVVYDITGHPLAFQPALHLARRFGKLLLLGDTARPGQQCLTLDVVTRGVQIIGAHDSMPPAVPNAQEMWTHIEMSHLFFNYLQRGQMRVSDLVTHRFKPEQAPQAYSDLLKDRSTALGVIFDW